MKVEKVWKCSWFSHFVYLIIITRNLNPTFNMYSLKSEMMRRLHCLQSSEWQLPALFRQLISLAHIWLLVENSIQTLSILLYTIYYIYIYTFRNDALNIILLPFSILYGKKKLRESSPSPISFHLKMFQIKKFRVGTGLEINIYKILITISRDREFMGRGMAPGGTIPWGTTSFYFIFHQKWEY